MRDLFAKGSYYGLYTLHGTRNRTGTGMDTIENKNVLQLDAYRPQQ